VLVTLLGFFGAPRSDSAPPYLFGARGIVASLAPSLRSCAAQETGSLFWYYAVMRLKFTKSVPLPAEAGCQVACERVFLTLVFIA